MGINGEITSFKIHVHIFKRLIPCISVRQCHQNTMASLDTVVSKKLKSIVDRMCTLTFTREDYAYVKFLMDTQFVRFPMSNLEVHWHPVFSRAPYRAGIFNKDLSVNVSSTAIQKFSRLKEGSLLLCKMVHIIPEFEEVSVQKGAHRTFIRVQQFMIVISDRTLRSMIFALHFVFDVVYKNLKFHNSARVARFILQQCERNGGRQRRQIKMHKMLTAESSDESSRLHHLPVHIVHIIESFLSPSYEKHIACMKL